MIATPTITQKTETPGADPFGARQLLQVYSTKPAPQGGMKKGKAQYERDDVQEGEEAGSPNAKKKARIPPSLLQNDRLCGVD